MEQPSENDLQQSVELAQQAAAQMKRAANLAEHAAQLWQKALTMANQEALAEPPASVQMAVAGSRRQRKQHIRPEMTRLIENARQTEPLASPRGGAKAALSAQPEHVWEDGDNWWKPRQQAEPVDA
jgi:hypothetical protein